MGTDGLAKARVHVIDGEAHDPEEVTGKPLAEVM
jgi:hypothetical protein